MKYVSAAAAGCLFAVGLILAGMTEPARILGFLDVAGAWDPSLAFVMTGALLVYAPMQLWITRREGIAGLVPRDAKIDAPLVVGACIFGVGWGLSGLCPGPVLVVVGSLMPQAILFAASMVAGALLWQAVSRGRPSADPE